MVIASEKAEMNRKYKGRSNGATVTVFIGKINKKSRNIDSL